MVISNVTYTEMVPVEREIQVETEYGVGDVIFAGKDENALTIYEIVIPEDPTDPWYVAGSVHENMVMKLHLRCEYADRVYMLQGEPQPETTIVTKEGIWDDIEVQVDVSKMSPAKVLEQYPERFNETQWRVARQVQDGFDVSNGSVSNWTKQGLKFTKFAGRMFFKVSDVNAYVSPSGKTVRSGWETIPY